MELRGHFGNAEHSYGHWLDLVLPEGEHPLWKLLRSHAEIACPGHGDAAPLRLVSWMSCEPPSHIEKLLQQLMLLFSAVQPESRTPVSYVCPSSQTLPNVRGLLENNWSLNRSYQPQTKPSKAEVPVDTAGIHHSP